MTHKTNKTNDEIVSLISINWNHGTQRELEDQLREALQAKNLQCQQEKVELVNDVPNKKGVCAVENCAIGCDRLIRQQKRLEDWKQNTLKRLSSKK